MFYSVGIFRTLGQERASQRTLTELSEEARGGASLYGSFATK